MKPIRFFNFIYAWCVQRVENRAEWDRDLLAPLPGTKARRPSTAELQTEGSDFMNFMGQMTGR